ncbi:NAD(P)-binding domain-containing protein [Paraburkholderia sp. Ac-20347]|uniref:flavin-containing monooxygenase n=1 Tax=Paraburkholderia sp. Ac-20347 TaxID=2703892 RepID=UPI0019811EC3|nr:NAD(P)-binding domain-containing protein [Paraburkholderia sp. Ac-20347]MBN3813890.1 NAD(P)-binding domain-containing protein [Paraburkholderia sp. Ac-20347]
MSDAQSTQSTHLPTKYLVVGAGPLGLIAARALLRGGVDVELAERHREIGGIWDIENPGSPMYETCHLITSKHLGGFLDYPMPTDYPTFPSWRLILAYIRNMAHEYGLYERTRFNTSVANASPIKVEGVDAWKVTMANGETRLYRGVVYACGQQWKPFIPEFEGMDRFKGEILRGNQYKSPSQFTGKRVLVVGAGNSGVDIAVDAAEHASKAFLSTRRAYHFLPKQIFGVPTPDLLDVRTPPPPIPGLPDHLSRKQLADLVVATVGDLGRYGLPVPDQPLGATHPIVSDLVLHCFSHGILAHRPNIRRFHENTIEFVDGRIEEIDLVLFCTGYDMDIPWLDKGLVDYDQGHPIFHLGAIAPKVRNLYAVGVLHPSRADAWATFDQLAQIVVADAVATLTGKGKETMDFIRNEYKPNLRGDFPFLNVRRNVNQVDTDQLVAMMDDLENRFGIPIPTHSKRGFYEPLRAQSATAQAQALEA